jgi:hypothetical protein
MLVEDYMTQRRACALTFTMKYLMSPERPVA